MCVYMTASMLFFQVIRHLPRLLSTDDDTLNFHLADEFRDCLDIALHAPR